MGLRALIVSFLNRPKKPKLYPFKYGYMVYPFDTRESYFIVRATDEAAAHMLALDKLKDMLEKGQTVVNGCWPIYGR